MVVSFPELNRDFIHAAVTMQPPGPQAERGRENQHQTFSLPPAAIVGRGHRLGGRMGVGHAKTTLMAIPCPSLGGQLLPRIHQKPSATVMDRPLTGCPSSPDIATGPGRGQPQTACIRPLSQQQGTAFFGVGRQQNAAQIRVATVINLQHGWRRPRRTDTLS